MGAFYYVTYWDIFICTKAQLSVEILSTVGYVAFATIHFDMQTCGLYVGFQLFGIPHVVIYNFDRIILHNDSFIKILTTFSQTIVFPLIIPLNLFSARSTVQLIAM